MAAYTSRHIAGAFLVELGGTGDPIDPKVTLGFTENGFEWVMRPSMTPIRSDVTGRVPLDAVLSGIEDMIIRMDLIEFTVANWRYLIDWIMNDEITPVEGMLDRTGSLAVTRSNTLLLTPIGATKGAPTVPETTSSQIYSFKNVYPLEPVSSILSAQRLRTMPVGFYVFGGDVDSTTYEKTEYVVSLVV